jgi:hypothetical protein
MQTVAKIEKIADPAKRLAAAARLAREATIEANKARTRRDLAAVTLHRVHGWKQVDVRNLIGCSRGLYVRIEQRTPVELPDIEDPEKVIREVLPVIARLNATVEKARTIRNEVADAMLDGHIRKPDGRVYSNADVHRMTGLTSARIAQLRVGTR